MAFKSALLDLDGVVFSGGTAIPGSLESIERLRDASIPVGFITNTTRMSRGQLIDKLRRLGLAISENELFTPAIAARRYLDDHGLSPHLLVHSDLRDDFGPEQPAEGRRAVVVGDAGDMFTYAELNAAFRLLDQGAPLIALARNMVFRDRDGDLSLDAGPFVAALEAAAGCVATILGKPSAAFFRSALAGTGVAAADAVMVGDDVEADVGGALAAGLSGILVRTGKYRDGDERRIDPAPTATVADLAAAVDAMLERG